MAPKTITLKGNPIRKEATANVATIKPGHLVERDSVGDVGLHGSAGQDCFPLIALENDIIGDDIDTAYADNDNVMLGYFRPGDEAYMWLDDGNNVAIEDLLESDGAGGLQAYTAQAVDEGATNTYTIYSRQVVARALEAVNNSSGVQVRIKVEIV